MNAAGDGGGVAGGVDLFRRITLLPGGTVTGYLFGEANPIPVLPAAPPLPTVDDPADPTKRMFLDSTPGAPALRAADERTTPDFAALGSVGSMHPPVFAATAEGPGGGLVRVFDLTAGAERYRFEPFPGFTGGLRVAVADVTGDEVPDVVVGAGPGGGPRVAVWDGRSLRTAAPVRLTPDFFAFETTLRDGTYPAVGDVDGDGFADVLTGAGPGGGPRVLGFSGAALTTGRQAVTVDFFAGGPAARGGAPLAAVDLDGDGRAEVFTGAGVGAAPVVRFTDPRTGRVIDQFAAEWLDFLGGISVG